MSGLSNMGPGSTSDTGYDGISTPVSQTVTDPDAVTTTSLRALQSEDQRKVMDIVDKLRRTGLSGIVELPQLVVCGDQSSGKSSVLEAITEIPFPRKENLCTRFATEIVLRRSSSSTISISITPDKLRPKEEHSKLKSFNKSIENFKELPEIIEEATQAMGLGVVGGINSRAFSRDVLSVQIDGPDRPQLTLVDLPGLIHSTNRAQTEADKELILNLVKEYMSNERTIILAVVSAKNDYANQIVLNYARKADKTGRRILGIITKPDFLREGSENEQSWIELAQNKDIYLERGWHMLKNRGDDQMKSSFADRNADENLFFSKGRYVDLPRECVGIDSFRERLSKLLLNHLVKELPSLKEEMHTKHQAVVTDIAKLGESRTTLNEQRTVLMKLSMKINDTLKSAVKGYYESSFFGAINMDAAVDATENIPRFRAVIQYSNIKFAGDMRLRGHKFAIGVDLGDNDRESADELDDETDNTGSVEELRSHTGPKPKSLTHKEAVAWVKKTLERSRGYELPGTFQPMLISQLFWEQSQPWEEIAKEHVVNIARLCRNFVNTVLEHTSPAEFLSRINSLSVDAALRRCLTRANEELNKILADKARHPMTYNHYFTTTVQKQRQRKLQKVMGKAASSSEFAIRNGGSTSTACDPTKLDQALTDSIEQNMDTFSSEEALDNQRAYYKDELKYFINATCKAVIERHLVEPLPDIILSPLVVSQMSQKEIEFVAAEPAEITQQRRFLESRKAMLEKGLDTFREAMGGLRR